MDPAGTRELAYIPRVSAGGEDARAHSSASTVSTGGEGDRWPPEAPLWAYCRELCGAEACDVAVAAILSALANEPGTIGEDELLLITRATAARFTPAATDAYSCAETPVRLAAWASGELDPDERHELRRHLAACLPCHSLKVKMDRAERGFASLSARTEAPAPPFDATEPPARTDPGSPAAPEDAPGAELRSGRAKAVLRSYCRELCGPIGSRRAVADIVAAAGLDARSTGVATDELLRVTRVAAAKQALIDADGQLSRDNPSAPRNPECAMTPTRLAAAANGELEPEVQLELERHLEHCLVCKASLIKLDRAERAYATLAAALAGAESEPEYEASDEAASAAGAAGAAGAAAGAAAALGATAPAAMPEPRYGMTGYAGAARRQARRGAPEFEPEFATAAMPEPRRGGASPAQDRPGPRRRAGSGAAVPVTRRRVRTRRLVAGLAALVAAGGAAAAVLAAGGAFSTVSTPTGSPAADHSTPAASAPAAVTKVTYHAATKARHVTKPKAKAAHRAPAKPHRATKARHVTKPKPKHTAARVAARPKATPPAPARAPVAAKPVTSAPKTSTPTVSPQQTNLPAQSAPTQGIGSSQG